MATYNQSQMTLPSGDVVKFIDNTSGYTKNTGTVTSVTVKTSAPLSGGSNTAVTSSGSWTISHDTSGATAGSYGDSGAQTPAAGGSFKVPYITINNTGHVTSISDHNVTLPSNTGTVTSVATGSGLTGGTITSSGTLKANLRSETKLTNDSAAATEVAGRVYPVALDKTGYLAVNVPWTDTNTDTDTDIRRAFYGTCSTAANESAKTVTLASTDGWSLTAGVIVGVYFSNSNTASSVTLNVNGSGAKSIYYNNAAYTGNSTAVTGYAKRVNYYMYDGTYWVFLSNGIIDSNNAVTQTATTTNSDYEVLFSATADNSNRTEGARKNSNLTFNPSTGNLTTTQLNGVTVGSSPKFTDTTYSAGTGLSLSGTTFNHSNSVTAGTAGTSSATSGSTLDVPYVTYDSAGHITGSGTHVHTVSGFATSSHTHTLSLATDTGTSAISLSSNTKYKLTAGGSTLIFTTPVDNNTTYSSKTAASGGTDVSLVTTGEKYTWNNKSNLAIGTTSTTAAAGNHTHATSIATSTGTSSITLAHGGKYALTAGGTSYIFTMPSDNNTRYDADAVCSTAASTAAKAASATSYVLRDGNRFTLRLTVANTNQGALTLNVNSTGAKPLYINGAASSSSNYTLPAGDYQVYYDGTNYYVRTDDKLPKYVLSTTSVGSASTGTAIAADDITAWTTNTPTAVTKKTVVTGATFNTVVTGGSTTAIPNISKKTVVTAASGATASYSGGILTLTNGSFTTGDSVTVGTAINAYTSLSTGVSGSATTGDSVSVTAGTAASLSYTARSIPNISVTSTTVATGGLEG